MISLSPARTGRLLIQYGIWQREHRLLLCGGGQKKNKKQKRAPTGIFRAGSSELKNAKPLGILRFRSKSFFFFLLMGERCFRGLCNCGHVCCADLLHDRHHHTPLPIISYECPRWDKNRGFSGTWPRRRTTTKTFEEAGDPASSRSFLAYETNPCLPRLGQTFNNLAVDCAALTAGRLS